MSHRLTRKDFLRLMSLGTLTAVTAGKSLSKPFVHSRNNEMTLYVGTYTTGKSKGIYRCRFDPSSGSINKTGVREGIINPSFLAIDPQKKYLYAVSETGNYQGKTSGSVDAYKITGSAGSLEYLNERPSHGAAPCHIIVDKESRYVMVANYNSGNIAVFPIEEDGRLGRATDIIQHHGSSINKERQAGPHAHCIVLDPDNRFALSCDLGTDKVMIYHFDAEKGKLLPADQPFAKVKPGLGPRHIAFHPNGKIIYVICEMGNVVLVFDYDPEKGRLRQKQSIPTIPSDFKGKTKAAELQASSDGRFLYASNRGADTLVVYAIHPQNGELSLVQTQPALGKFPRHFIIDPTGKYLIAANKNSDNIVVFSINQETGKLAPTGETLDIPAPVCVTFG